MSTIGCICLFLPEIDRCDQRMRSQRRVWEGGGMGGEEVDSTQELSATSGQIIAVPFSVQLIVFQNVEYQSAPQVRQR